MFFSVYNTFPHALFYARFRHFRKTYLFFPTTHIPVFTSRKRLVCFAPYINSFLAQFFWTCTGHITAKHMFCLYNTTYPWFHTREASCMLYALYKTSPGEWNYNILSQNNLTYKINVFSCNQNYLNKLHSYPDTSEVHDAFNNNRKAWHCQKDRSNTIW